MKKYFFSILFLLGFSAFCQTSFKDQALSISAEARKTAEEAARTALTSAAEHTIHEGNKHGLLEGINATVNPKPEIKPLPWNLILYRPENGGGLNEVRCWVKIIDAETGEDVTYTKISATYEWVNMSKKYEKDPTQLWAMITPDSTAVYWRYQRTYYLSGGMAMHLRLPEGKYIISLNTPAEKRGFFEFETENKGTWISNEYYYDTEYPAKVLFVAPTANDNGFYNGGWDISLHAPGWFNFTTTPKMEK